MAPVITVDNLGIRFPGNDEWTLKSLSLQVEANEFVALVGGSGVGKSTLLRVIAGLLPVMAGSINYLRLARRVSDSVHWCFRTVAYCHGLPLEKI